MNIKNLINANIPVGGVSSAGAANAKAIKSEITHDRDGNGQEAYQRQQKKKQKMTKEDAEKAIGRINAKQFMSDMSWKAKLIDEDGFFYAIVEDSQQNIIRKIGEFDLWDALDASYLQDSDTSKGNLLKRTA